MKKSLLVNLLFYSFMVPIILGCSDDSVSQQQLDTNKIILSAQKQNPRAQKETKLAAQADDKETFNKEIFIRETLLQLLRRGYILEGNNIAQLLHSGGAMAMDALINALKNEPPNIRAESAIVLGEIITPNTRDAVQPLITALMKDDDPKVRVFAAEALGKIKDTRAIEPLITVIEDKQLFL